MTDKPRFLVIDQARLPAYSVVERAVWLWLTDEEYAAVIERE